MKITKVKTDCRHFNGYKPCRQQSHCELCEDYSPIAKNILIIHLGALGAVVRSTALLNAIVKKYPGSAITWITDKPADKILKGHPDLHRVLSSDPQELQMLLPIKFDIGFVIDKSLRAVGISKMLKIKSIMGFTATDLGAIIPANPEAEELWQLGLSDYQKFFQNLKSEVQLVAEMLGLADTSTAAQVQKIVQENFDYNLPLTELEKKSLIERRRTWIQVKSQVLIGINTGCSEALPAKKLSIENHRELIKKLKRAGFENIVLLGGPEDQMRNHEIAQWTNVFASPTTLGLRDGLVSVAACDIVITGDSLGMHMAIAQKKEVIAWFGPTCAQEIELYGRGQKIQSKAACAPCWKKACGQSKMCYDQVDLEEIVFATKAASEKIKNASASKENEWEMPQEFLSFNPPF